MLRPGCRSIALRIVLMALNFATAVSLQVLMWRNGMWRKDRWTEKPDAVPPLQPRATVERLRT